ncbi:hypothetical protein AAFF_G00051530 [Aldrovandia affinis]|uniref:Supervillin-like n=1 Tax=Aldrovandia affinis TaxID=143900 RepID=A0AAD7WZ49_9TELE|nr:hypothetical protein AAFF_G00051530 [Aldrovandia affinis]
MESPALESKAERIARYKAERRRELAERYGAIEEVPSKYVTKDRREGSESVTKAPHETPKAAVSEPEGKLPGKDGSLMGDASDCTSGQVEESAPGTVGDEGDGGSDGRETTRAPSREPVTRKVSNGEVVSSGGLSAISSSLETQEGQRPKADDAKTGDRAKMSIAAKMSLFKELEKTSDGATERRIRRSNEHRALTQPITSEEMVMATSLPKGARSGEAQAEQAGLEVGDSKLALFNKISLEGEVEPVIDAADKRRQKGVTKRHSTQPVTMEEVEMVQTGLTEQPPLQLSAHPSESDRQQAPEGDTPAEPVDTDPGEAGLPACCTDELDDARPDDSQREAQWREPLDHEEEEEEEEEEEDDEDEVEEDLDSDGDSPGGREESSKGSEGDESPLSSTPCRQRGSSSSFGEESSAKPSSQDALRTPSPDELCSLEKSLSLSEEGEELDSLDGSSSSSLKDRLSDMATGEEDWRSKLKKSKPSEVIQTSLADRCNQLQGAEDAWRKKKATAEVETKVSLADRMRVLQAKEEQWKTKGRGAANDSTQFTVAGRMAKRGLVLGKEESPTFHSKKSSTGTPVKPLEEISTRTDVEVEGDKRLDKLESFLDKLHNKGMGPRETSIKVTAETVKEVMTLDDEETFGRFYRVISPSALSSSSPTDPEQDFSSISATHPSTTRSPSLEEGSVWGPA